MIIGIAEQAVEYLIVNKPLIYLQENKLDLTQISTLYLLLGEPALRLSKSEWSFLGYRSLDLDLIVLAYSFQSLTHKRFRYASKVIVLRETVFLLILCCLEGTVNSVHRPRWYGDIIHADALSREPIVDEKRLKCFPESSWKAVQ
jgi:hypothetical protein